MRNSVFKDQTPSTHLNRTTYDLSFQNNGTYQFGKLYPVFCKPVIPGDSVKIQPTFGLKFMPMVFPIQSRMRGTINFFYVKNRNIWDKWQEFITGNDVAVGKNEPEMPYIDLPKSSEFFKTGKLADYLGIPTEQFQSFTSASGLGVDVYAFPGIFKEDKSDFWAFYDMPTENIEGYDPSAESPMALDYRSSECKYGTSYENVSDLVILKSVGTLSQGKPVIVTGLKVQFTSAPSGDVRLYFSTSQDSLSITSHYSKTGISYGTVYGTENYSGLHMKMDSILLKYADYDPTIQGWRIDVNQNSEYAKLANMNGNCYLYNTFKNGLGVTYTLDGYIDDDSSNIPFYNDFSNADKRIRISALPFRVYESIYNAFYRNELVDPLMIGGYPNYVEWTPNRGSGSDTHVYDFHYQNWEKDVFTSCYPSPQQGLAPLAGVSTNVGVNGDFTFTLTNQPGVDGLAASYQFGNVGTDGQVLLKAPSGGGAVTSYQSLRNAENKPNFVIRTKVTPTGDITGISDVDPDTPQEYVHYVKDIIRQGISINTLRNCNALQELLENTMRAGYRYRDNLKGLFGVDPGADTLQMPEYLGGVTQNITVSSITNNSPSEGSSMQDALGGYAGQANAFGSGRPITKFCDDYGYIIGILHLSVEPVYSQTIAKDWLKNTRLDYYFDEFKNVGLQPLYTHELTPLQVASDSRIDFNKVFGYQRYGYDTLIAQDEVHGEMRDTLKNYLMMREFHSTPYLSTDFIQIKPEQLNDVFAVTTTDNDVCQGQIWFDYSKKTIVPRFSIPRL